MNNNIINNIKNQKVVNVSNEASDSNFVTRKWNIVNDQSSVTYDVGNKIIYSAEVLKCNLSDYNDVYNLVGGDSTKTVHNYLTIVAIGKCAPFIKCITKIDGTTLDNNEDLDLVVSIVQFHRI